MVAYGRDLNRSVTVSESFSSVALGTVSVSWVVLGFPSVFVNNHGSYVTSQKKSYF